MVELLRRVALGMMAAGALFFLDTPFRTIGQRFIAHRWRERLVLFTFELDLVALWALGRFYLKWDRRLLPISFEPALAAIGIALVVLGVLLAAWAKARLGRWFSGSFAVKEGHELVTDGPYAITRHPIYTGILATVLGAALAWDSLLTLLLAALFVLPLFMHTVYEESLFEQHFGDAYHDYERRVPRLVPFARRAPTS